jgi:hypothetical protein
MTRVEGEMLERIAAVVPIGAPFKYTGYAEPTRNDLELSFRFEASQPFSDPTTPPAISLELRVRGDVEDDRKAIRALRDALFCGSGELILLTTGSEAGAWRIVMTAMYCAHCGRAMIDRISCEWETCNACAARCAHEYERGAVHGGEALLEVDEYCTRCGRVKSSDQPLRPAEELVREAEQELGVIVLEDTNLHEIGQHLRALTWKPS